MWHLKDLTEESVVKTGKGVGSYFQRNGINKISVGYDCRLHSKRMFEYLSKGLRAVGVSVIDIGMIATPVLYYSQFKLSLEGGIMITGSHNPKEYNGFKICKRKMTIGGEEIQKILRIIEKSEYYESETKGSLSSEDIFDSYINRIVSDIKIGPSLKKVVIDSANGTGGPFIKAALDKLGVDAEYLYNDPDGNFPNHHPDPSVPENLKDLADTIKKTGADLGFAFDGDSDRVGVLNEKSEIIWGDMLLLLLGKQLKKEIKSPVVIGEVKCSERMYEELEKAGVKSIMSKVGHSFIKQRLVDEKADLAGEVSGHFFYKNRYYGYDDGIYTALRTLEIVSNTRKKLSTLTKLDKPVFNTPEIKVKIREREKARAVEICKEYYKGQGLKLIEIDGVRVKFEDGWGLIRPSNTTPHLVLRFEAKSEKRLNKYKEEALNLLRGIE